jgi:hypothetical protein
MNKLIGRVRSRWKTLRRRGEAAYMRFERTVLPVRRLRNRIKTYRTSVFFVSFPKSGRTWVRFVLGQAIQTQYGIAKERKLALDSTLYKMVTGKSIKISHDYGAREDAGYSGMNKRAFKGKRVFLLTRDIRDTLVSYYHHRYDRFGKIDMPLSEYVRSEIYGARKIALFYRSWHDNQHLPSAFLRVRYEELRQEPFPQMRRIADFLLLNVISDDVLQAACDAGEFSNMRRLELNNEIVLLSRDGDASKMSENATRVRKGKVGGYTEELSADDLAYIDQVVEEVGIPKSWVYYDAEVNS